MKARTALLIYGGLAIASIVAPIVRVLAGFGRRCRNLVRRRHADPELTDEVCEAVARAEGVEL